MIGASIIVAELYDQWPGIAPVTPGELLMGLTVCFAAIAFSLMPLCLVRRIKIDPATRTYRCTGGFGQLIAEGTFRDFDRLTLTRTTRRASTGAGPDVEIEALSLHLVFKDLAVPACVLVEVAQPNATLAYLRMLGNANELGAVLSLPVEDLTSLAFNGPRALGAG